MQHRTRFIATNKCHPHFLNDDKAAYFLITRDILERGSISLASIEDPNFLTVLEEDSEYPKLIDAVINSSTSAQPNQEEQCKVHAEIIAIMKQDLEQQNKAHQIELQKLKEEHETRVNKLVKSNVDLQDQVTSLRNDLEELLGKIERFDAAYSERNVAFAGIKSACNRRRHVQ